MKRALFLMIAVLLLLSFAGSAQAVLGIPDRVPGSTLIVPMFEVGIDAVANPHDTYAVVWNRSNTTINVHYVVWDIDGHSALQGNFVLNTAVSNSLSLRLLIDPAPQAVKDQLTDGAFYHGFMTFDEVTGPTSVLPTNASYPFASTNALEGFIYYVRLEQGSTNGLSMISLEAVGSVTNDSLHGFYQNGDDREEIDADARHTAEALSRGQAPPATGSQTIDRIHNRVYSVESMLGFTKVVIFAWPEGGGYCLGSTPCGPTIQAYQVYPSKWYNEAGTILIDTTLSLNHVVNIFVISSPTGWGNTSGIASLWDFLNGWEVYAFTINSANPANNPLLTWDAVFESFIVP